MKDEMLSAAKTDLVLMMKRQGEVTIKEATTALGLASTTIRQHLSKLEQDGFVDRRLDRSGVGRSSQLYYLTKKANTFFQNREPALLIHLIRSLLAAGEMDRLKSIYSSFCADQLAHWKRRTTTHLSDTEKTAELQRLLKELGYIPKCDYDADHRLVIELFHCPYPNVARLIPFQCECEQRLFEDLTDTTLTRECGLTNGNESCRFRESSEK
jgi:predicted ArsR family transcriptional regulator